MTMQRPEKLIYNDKKYIMYVFPDIGPMYDKSIQSSKSTIMSTDCWRGYQATWKIENNKFYLYDIEGGYNKINDELILVDWGINILVLSDIIISINYGKIDTFKCQNKHINVGHKIRMLYNYCNLMDYEIIEKLK